jgi:hypothetical protein
MTRATTLLWIKGNSTIVTRATAPSQQQQGHLLIDNGNNTIIMRATIAIATMAKTLAHQWQQCHCNKGNNTSSAMSNKGNDTSLTTAKTPAHQRWQQLNCDNSNHCHCSMTMMPA